MFQVTNPAVEWSDHQKGKGSRKKSSFYWTVHLEGGGQGLSTKEKRNLFLCKEKSSYGHLAEGEGLKALVHGRATKKRTFFAVPNSFPIFLFLI